MKPITVIQNCEAESAGTILDYLNERAHAYTLIHTYKGQTLPPFNSSGQIISLGCPESVTQYQQHDYLKNLYAYVARAIRDKTPYLGICFGGQLLAKIMGATVERNDKPEIGVYKVRLTDSGKTDPLFAGFPESFPVFHWHADRFRAPFGYNLLAEGDDCKYQAFRAENSVALQFHLEATADEAGKWCDIYKDELKAFGSTKDEIVAAATEVAVETKRLNYLLLDNFLKLTQ